MYAVGEEVGGVGYEDDEAALNLGQPSQVCELEEESGAGADNDTDEQASEEDEQEDAGTLEEAEEAVATGLALVVLLGRLEDDNGNGVVEDGLAEDDGVELGVNLVRVEDGEDGDGIGSGEGGPDGYCVDKGHVEGAGDLGEEPEDEADDDGGEKGAGKGKGEDCANIAEKVGLVEFVARGEDDGREEKVEEDLVVEADEVSDRVA